MDACNFAHHAIKLPTLCWQAHGFPEHPCAAFRRMEVKPLLLHTGLCLAPPAVAEWGKGSGPGAELGSWCGGSPSARFQTLLVALRRQNCLEPHYEAMLERCPSRHQLTVVSCTELPSFCYIL